MFEKEYFFVDSIAVFVVVFVSVVLLFDAQRKQKLHFVPSASCWQQ